MYKCLQPLILASGSPRRKEFFDTLGFEYSIFTVPVEELVREGEQPDNFVSRMAVEKAEAVALQRKDFWIVAADTIVCTADKILGKPVDFDDAVEMLCQLSGKDHIVLTAFCLMNKAQRVQEVEVVKTKVLFTPFSQQTAMAYVATGEPFDKAGSYGIQGVGGCLVEKIEGSYSNIIGLPLAELIGCLRKHKVITCSK